MKVKELRDRLADHADDAEVIIANFVDLSVPLCANSIKAVCYPNSWWVKGESGGAAVLWAGDHEHLVGPPPPGRVMIKIDRDVAEQIVRGWIGSPDDRDALMLACREALQ